MLSMWGVEAPSMKHFSDEEQQEIRERLSIEAVLAHYNLLDDPKAQSLGRETVRCCPIHPDRNPSFSYNESKGVWKCHSTCGGGDVFRLIEALEGCSFPDAKRKAAEICNYESKIDPDPFRIARHNYRKQIAACIENAVQRKFVQACSKADQAQREGLDEFKAAAQVIAGRCHELLLQGNLRHMAAFLLGRANENIEFLTEVETVEELIDALSTCLAPSTFQQVLGAVQQRLELSRHSRTDLAPAPILNEEFEQQKARVLEDARLLYRSELLQNNADSKRARQYLEDRGITQEACEEFSVGYAPPGGNWFVAYCEGRDLVEAGIAVGLIKDCPARGLVDLFVDRLMLPFLDGPHVTAFTGRALHKSQVPKYKHTAGSKTGQILYGWNQVKIPALTRTAMLVEGQFDVLAANSAELNLAYALSGTNLSDTQARMLRMRVEQVLVVMDGDEPGQKAAEKIVETCKRWGLKAATLRIRNEMDVADVIQAGGGAKLLDALESRLYD